MSQVTIYIVLRNKSFAGICYVDLFIWCHRLAAISGLDFVSPIIFTNLVWWKKFLNSVMVWCCPLFRRNTKTIKKSKCSTFIASKYRISYMKWWVLEEDFCTYLATVRAYGWTLSLGTELLFHLMLARSTDIFNFLFSWQILDEMPVFYNLSAIEKREVLVVFLQIVHNMDDASLVKAWQQSIARTRLFFKLLEECLILFEVIVIWYAGYAWISRDEFVTFYVVIGILHS